MDEFTAVNLSQKLTSKITCLIMEEITKNYQTDSDYVDFVRDYELIQFLIIKRLLRPVQGAKVLSPVESPLNALPAGINLN